MPEHIHYSDDDLVNPETHHEESDVNIRALMWFAVIFVILAVVTHIALWFMYKGLVNLENRRPTEPLTQLQRPEDAVVPQNQPLLQPFPRRLGVGEEEVVPPYRTTPRTDLRDMRRAEQEALQSYGWVDQQKGTVRIPIDVAKRLVVERGLPVQSGDAPAEPETTTTGGQQ